MKKAKTPCLQQIVLATKLPEANGRIQDKENNKKDLPNTYILNDKHFARESPDFFNKAEDNISPSKSPEFLPSACLKHCA